MDSKRFHHFSLRRFLEELERRDTPTFTALPAFTTGINTPTVIASGDFNGDGYADLAIGNDTNEAVTPASPASVTIELGNGDGTFTQVQTLTDVNLGTPQSIVVADFNHDGIPDLVVGSISSVDGLDVFLGKGDGAFTGPTLSLNIPVIAVGVADFNGDGNPDLVVLSPEIGSTDASYQIFPGLGNGTFTTTTTPQDTTADVSRIVTGDFDNDGHQDFILGDAGDNLLVPFFGDGTG
ncbi:MAG TPA: VCBS repeat-containing protein, partial [Urbifossiella sp.]